MSAALTQFSTDMGCLPTPAEGLDALLSATPNCSNWHGPYILHPPKDPWGNPYVYRILPNRNFEVRSAGPDGKPYTRDDILDANNNK